MAAARAVVDGGRPKAEVMAEHGVASASPLDAWCRAYREGGEEALRPRPKGRPRGSGARAAARTREQELEERVRRLEAEVSICSHEHLRLLYMSTNAIAVWHRCPCAWHRHRRLTC